MSKEIEAFKRIKTAWDAEGNELQDWIDDNDINIVENGLKRLNSIDNANTSEALEEIKTLRGFNQVELNNDKNINKSLDVIEQALLKSQEEKKKKARHILTFDEIKKLAYEDKIVEFIGERLDKKYLIIYRLDEDEMDICFEDTYTYLFTVHDDEIREIDFFNDLHLEVVK